MHKKTTAQTRAKALQQEADSPPRLQGGIQLPKLTRGSLRPAAHASAQGALCAPWHLSPPPRIPISPGVPKPAPSSEGLWQLLPPRATSRHAPLHGLAELWAGTVALPAQACRQAQAGRQMQAGTHTLLCCSPLVCRGVGLGQHGQDERDGRHFMPLWQSHMWLLEPCSCWADGAGSPVGTGQPRSAPLNEGRRRAVKGPWGSGLQPEVLTGRAGFQCSQGSCCLFPWAVPLTPRATASTQLPVPALLENTHMHNPPPPKCVFPNPVPRVDPQTRGNAAGRTGRGKPKGQCCTWRHKSQPESLQGRQILLCLCPRCSLHRYGWVLPRRSPGDLPHINPPAPEIPVSQQEK